ncbi:PAS domain-containing protein, partial [Archangium sp.]|uniref:PAS domain-containing protein n=1 Tax=Archangium sp. TaxID=1872627 RepID=UPI002ED92EBB
MIELVTRLAANEPHVRCQVGEGALAPLAVALNHLATTLDGRRAKSNDSFGIETLVAQSPIMMQTCDADACIRFINYTIPGLSPTEVVGKSFYHFAPPEDVEMMRSHVRRVLTTGETVSYEHRPALLNGPEWYGVKLGPIRGGEKVVGFTVSLMDITDLKRTQLCLEQSNRELENFATVASHDLQEPLRKIQTFSERLTAMCA